LCACVLLIAKHTDYICADVNYHVVWSIFRKFRRNMWFQGFCECVRESSGCRSLWTVFGRTYRRIHILVAFCDGNPTYSHHYRFSLRRTWWRLVFNLMLGIRSKMIWCFVCFVFKVHQCFFLLLFNFSLRKTILYFIQNNFQIT